MRRKASSLTEQEIKEINDMIITGSNTEEEQKLTTKKIIDKYNLTFSGVTLLCTQQILYILEKAEDFEIQMNSDGLPEELSSDPRVKWVFPTTGVAG